MASLVTRDVQEMSRRPKLCFANQIPMPVVAACSRPSGFLPTHTHFLNLPPPQYRYPHRNSPMHSSIKSLLQTELRHFGMIR